jgi:hypothetical protein
MIIAVVKIKEKAMQDLLLFIEVGIIYILVSLVLWFAIKGDWLIEGKRPYKIAASIFWPFSPIIIIGLFVWDAFIPYTIQDLRA